MRKWWRGVFFIAGLAIAGGCGSGVEGPPGDHGEFESYFQAFEVASLAEGRDIRGDRTVEIRFDTLNPQESGRCEWGFLKTRVVKIAQNRWDGLDEGGRTALIFHELGHCLLHRLHTSDRFTDLDMLDSSERDIDGSPKSIMNPTCIGGDQFERWHTYYVHELFHPEEAPEWPSPTPTPMPTLTVSATPTATPTPNR